MSSYFQRSLIGAAVALLAASGASAQTTANASSSATVLGPVVVTAARGEQLLADTLGDVSVIDSETLGAAGQSSLAEVLRREHGVEIVANGGPHNSTSVFLRGASNAQTLVLLDGQRIGSATAGGASFNAIPASSIERIEIIRGAASSLYGADAIGGVINVITKKGATNAPFAVNGSIGAGSYNTRKLTAGVSGNDGILTYGFQASHATSDGFSSRRPIGSSYNPDDDGYTLDAINGNIGLNWKPGQKLEATFFHSYLHGQYDSRPRADDRTISRVEGLALTSTNKITDLWTSRLRYGETTDKSRDISATTSVFNTRQQQISWQNDLAFAPGQNLSIAAEHLNEVVSSSSYLASAPGSRRTNSVTGVYRGDFGPHHTQISLRHDDSSQYGGKTSGNVSYGYDINRVLQVTGAAGTGFRAPSFNELYFPGYGQPAVLPERSRNLEAGLRYRDGGTDAGVTVYRNKVRNLISSLTPCPFPGYAFGCAYNVDRAVLEGVTLTAGQQFGATNLRASLDLQDAHDAKTGNQLARRAEQILRLDAEHRIGKALIGAELFASGHRYDNLANTTRLGGYTLLNLRVAYDVTREIQAQVRWNNVANKDYELARGYNTPGSNVFFNLVYRPE
ncbi:TonB-dependent receptor [Pigmentiphaga aceris]|uniref:TonB-dependent receptor n=1 Tax=Pigmentiphaga aceris TaxID=1940612 RepID=A0A5C0B827_9BURK|nr:TonB-dependent receptor [Pigmentiphaga aceris]QEI08967.1 TonB-dependent receptor [Pigmentiphaga aceris]